MKYFEKFHPNTFYHVFNHAVGFENLFRSRENFLYFLQRFNKYFQPVGNVYAYCLMPNHFHFLLQVKDTESLLLYANSKHNNEFDPHKLVMQQLSNCLNGYAKTYNKQYSRKGALFLDFTKRIKVVACRRVRFYEYQPCCQ